MKILVRNLAIETLESELKTMFEEFGTVQSCFLVLDPETGKSKGFAFVEMPKVGAAKAAVKNLNGKEVDGNVIRVKKSDSKKKPGKHIPVEPAPVEKKKERPPMRRFSLDTPKDESED